MSVLLPHKSLNGNMVPLRRMSCSHEEPITPCTKKIVSLMHFLWQKPSTNEKIEKLFNLHRLLTYSSARGDRRYAAPFLHQFFTPTKEGMEWLQDRFLKKSGLAVSFVYYFEHLEKLKEKVVAQEGACFEPLIIFDQTNFWLHATPCFFLKNTHGQFFFHLDSVAGESLNLPHKILATIIKPKFTWFLNTESRQKDGFSCRVEGFLILKQIFKSFKMKPELSPHDIFATIKDSEKLEGVKEGVLRGCFLKTSQAVVEDARNQEQLIGEEMTLGQFQTKFMASYERVIETVESSVSDMQKSCLYLQCKMLKYVFEFQKEIEEVENRFKTIEFRTNEEF